MILFTKIAGASCSGYFDYILVFCLFAAIKDYLIYGSYFAETKVVDIFDSSY